ncbi:MAG: MBL fold metallo-hydrolase [Clostridia bacterium]|nr:MBL fold metallo-hydrolase [Clostridia bacterium]
MYELVQITENCYYIESPAKIGMVKTGENEVVLIDSGNDSDAGKKVKKILDANGWTLKAIYNTHSNADHVGGNKLLQDRTGCSCYAPGIECDITNHPVLEPSYLFGGYPPKELRHKFLMAKASVCQPLTQEVLPEGMELINLPGHFFDMAGFKTADGVIYLADCLSSRQTLEKYRIGVIYDVAAYLETLEFVKTLEAKTFVPAHAAACEDIKELAQYNIDTVNEIADRIIEFCKEKICFEDLLKKLFDSYNLAMSIEQYVLVGSTVKSYLAWLKDNGRVQIVIEDNRVLWEAAA